MTPFVEQFLLVHPELRLAVEYAAEAHGDQKRLHGTPYYEHPVAVCQIVMERFGIKDAPILQAALFHDVLEDTKVTRETLASDWSEAVAAIVGELTKPPRPAGVEKTDWSQQIYRRLGRASAAAKIIKCADRMHNLSQMKHASEKFRQQYIADTELLIPALEDCSYVHHLKSDFAAIRAESR